ncbi:hypothetical protein BD560DRAFT_487628 [Blakeslea trispora]|nr:hypothetical protein BD560DRAFT_487628 [Blakeslea trispora]
MHCLPFENYPIEVIELIANHLTARQKGVCQMVCRSWRYLFISLQYHHVQLLGQNQLNLFIQSIQASDLGGSCVRQLHLDDSMLRYEQLITLLNYCPKLVSLSYKKDMTTQDDIHKQMLLSRQIHLKRLIEFQGLDVTHCLLYGPSTSHPQIVQLSLSFEGFTKVTKEDLISRLDMLPNLLDLSLDSVCLSFSDLEAIHTSCNRLRELTFSNTTMCPEAADVADKMTIENKVFVPAKSLHSFRLANVTDLNAHFEWMFYIAKKYPHLHHIELWHTFSVSKPIEEEMDVEIIDTCRYALSQIGKHCSLLKTAKFLSVHVDQRLFDELDAAGAKLEAISLGDMCDWNLSLLSHLGASQQNITHLTVWGWPSLCIPGEMEKLFSILSHSSNQLKHLSISMQFAGIKNSPFPLDQLLILCSNLCSVELDGFRVLCRPINHNDQLAPSIQLTHLAIRNGCFDASLLNRVGSLCQHMESLVLDSCDVIGESHNKQLLIHLPDKRLKSIHLNYLYFPEAYHRFGTKSNGLEWFDVTITSRKIQHRLFELKEYEYYCSDLSFNYEQKQHPLYRPTQCIDHGDARIEQHSPLVFIHCKALDELKICEFQVL